MMVTFHRDILLKFSRSMFLPVIPTHPMAARGIYIPLNVSVFLASVCRMVLLI